MYTHELEVGQIKFHNILSFNGTGLKLKYLCNRWAMSTDPVLSHGTVSDVTSCWVDTWEVRKLRSSMEGVPGVFTENILDRLQPPSSFFSSASKAFE